MGGLGVGMSLQDYTTLQTLNPTNPKPASNLNEHTLKPTP